MRDGTNGFFTAPHTSHLTPHTSHFTLHTSHFTVWLFYQRSISVHQRSGSSVFYLANL